MGDFYKNINDYALIFNVTITQLLKPFNRVLPFFVHFLSIAQKRTTFAGNFHIMEINGYYEIEPQIRLK